MTTNDRPVEDGLISITLSYNHLSPSKRRDDLQVTSPTELSLCDRCSQLDFENILYGQHEAPKWDGAKVTVAEPRDTQANGRSDCIICDTVENLRAERNPAYGPASLQAFPSEDSRWLAYNFPLLLDLSPRIVLAVHNSLLVPQTVDNEFVRALDPKTVNYNVLKEWLSMCENMHTVNCAIVDRTPIEYLMLLDCNTRRLVPAAALPYVTLSYVWGENEQAPIYTEQLNSRLPATIEDSITVTMKLGLHYLWIDRYCINQQNKEQAMSQIQQMDLIYRYSEVTIIAAAGAGPNYGLAGVSRARRPQAVAKLEKIQLVSPGNVAHHVLKDSKWSTRGWTFQEAYLSRSRLVFADEQVYYECGGMYSYESLNIPLASMHNGDGQSLQDKYSTFVYGKIVVFPGGVGHVDLSIFDRIMEYSRRTFTYPSDRLNGFLGIAKAFEVGRNSIRHLWGMPIIPIRRKYHHEAIFASMCFLYDDAKRIPSLPSWSWVGWDDFVTYTHMGAMHELKQSPNATVSVELVDGDVLDWSEFHDTYALNNDLNRISPCIHLSAWAVKARISRRKNLGCHTELEMRDGCYLSMKFDAHDHRFTANECMGLLTIDNRTPNMDRMIYLILIAEVDGQMERIGGSWLPMESILYDATGEAVIRKGKKHGEQFTKYEDLVARYGEQWYNHLVSTYKTFRIR